MKQLTNLRDDFGSKAQWVRIGMLSASVVAPLIARWNDLRSDGKAKSLAESASARLDDVREKVAAGRIGDALRQVVPGVDRAEQERKRRGATLWLIGAVVGLTAAGVTAYVVARRRMGMAEEEPMVELPSRSSRGRRGATTTSPSTSGATMTMEPAGSREAMPAQRGGFGPAEVVEPGMPEPGQVPARAAGVPEGVTPDPLPTPEEGNEAMYKSLDAGTANEPTSIDEIDTPAEANAALFIGNIHSMIYHQAGDMEHLPAEENRVYFATEDEAREAGFRRNKAEVAPPESQVRTSEAPGAQ